MLSLNNIEVIYDGVILVLKGVSIEVREGGITTLLGANGAGKTTTLKAVSGLLRTERGEVTKGTIELGGQRIDRLPAFEVVQRGVVQVFEGRRVFEHLTTEENLIAGAHIQSDGKRVAASIERVYQYFPRLKERRGVQAGYLSGGEQQMLVIGRALMSTPRVILLDEPSLGLAPMLVEEIFEIVQRLNREQKLTVLLVEQNAALALGIADHGYVMENGRIVLEGSGGGARQQCRHQGVLSRPDGGRGAEVVSRREALQAAQAVAVVSALRRRVAFVTPGGAGARTLPPGHAEPRPAPPLVRGHEIGGFSLRWSAEDTVPAGGCAPPAPPGAARSCIAGSRLCGIESLVVLVYEVMRRRRVNFSTLPIAVRGRASRKMTSRGCL